MKVKRSKLEYKEIHRNSEWLIVKPLNLKSSLKYGFNTKWCTSSKKEPHLFYNYSKEGILIYVIERKTNTKWAIFWEINEKGMKKDLSWWNSVDDRLDSMLVMIPETIMDKIKKELFLESKPNYFYFTESEKKNYITVKETHEKEESSRDWEIYRNDGLTHDGYVDFTTSSTTLDVDKMVNKTLLHKYSYEAIKDSLTVPYIPRETND